MSKIIDWSEFYQTSKIKGWQLPAFKEIDSEEGEYRDLWLNWSKTEVIKNHNYHTPSGEELPLWFICVDVLNINNDILISPTTIIFARRIEIAEGVSLVLDRSEGNSQDLIIFSQGVFDKVTGQPSELRIQCAGNEGVKKRAFQPSILDNGITGFKWGASKNEPNKLKVSDLDSAYLLEGEPLRLSLTTIFQVATLLSTENSNVLEISISQFLWVNKLAQVSQETIDLAGQADSMRTNLIAKMRTDPDTLIVPNLDLSIYANKAIAYQSLLNNRQEQWRNILAVIDETENWKNSAEDSITTDLVQEDLLIKIENQSLATRQEVLNGKDIAAKQLLLQKKFVTESKIDFDRGISNWEKSENLKASIDLVKGVGKILTQIPIIVAGSPQMSIGLISDSLETIPEAVEVLRDIPGLVKDITSPSKEEDPVLDHKANVKYLVNQAKEAKIASTKSDLKEGLAQAGEGGQQAFGAVTRLLEVARMAEQLEDTSSEILDNVDNATGEALSSIETTGVDDFTGGAQVWDLILIDIEGIFENIPVFKDIDGAGQYQIEIRKLIVHGKVLCKARLALTKANAELAELKWRRIAAKNTIEIAKRRLQKLEKKIATDSTFLQIIFGRVLDTKRFIYQALESYNRAFVYFTLAPLSSIPVLPRITDSVDQFGLAIAKISSMEMVLDALIPPPQSMVEVVHRANESELNHLKEYGFLSLVLTPDDDCFTNFKRIRFYRVRVFVDGISTTEKVKVCIRTSGSYTDKVDEDNVKYFVGYPTSKNFVYNGIDQSIVFDGDIAPRYREDYFIPTPFTSWLFQITNQDSENLDLAGASNFRIVFNGEATTDL